MLEYHDDGSGGSNVVLTECPFCAYRFEDGPSVTDSGVRYECSCAGAESGCWCLPKQDVLGE